VPSDDLTPATGHRNNHILLVEDDEGDSLLVRECLAEIDVDRRWLVTWRRTLAAGIAAVDTGTACVLLDLGLPDADGLSALYAIVDASPDTPVIVLTGRHDSVGDAVLAGGAQDYLVKDDISGELLDRSIRYAIERKRAARTRQQLLEAKLRSAEYARLERGLLPTPLLLSDRVECTTYYQPGRNHAVLGGDFFDVVETADGTVRAVIGDVMGHGPDEAALGVHLRVAWRTLVLAGTPESQILPALATLLEAERGGDNAFVTACDVTIEPDRTLSVRVAGHPAPLLRHDGKTSYLDVAIGPPLGVSPRVHGPTAGGPWRRTHAGQLAPGTLLVLYTDGLLEAHRRADDQSSLGITELIDSVERCCGRGVPPAAWTVSLVDEAPSHSVDDTAVVVIECREPART
jgi:serine phosphatase RsbU (regulator of sigma subunit)